MSNPQFVVIDLETRSACNLRDRGGYLYAKDPTTRLLTVSWWVDGEYHVWLPGVDSLPEALRKQHLEGVTVHLGPTRPHIPTDRTWIGHNAWGFDEPVWATLMPPEAQPRRWEDSQCHAAAAGLPMGLNQIGVRLWGEGKYAEGSAALMKASIATSINDCEACDVPVGVTALVARYNVQDVKLTLDLMWHLNDTLHLTPEERELQRAHREINARGCRIDTEMLSALYRLSNEAVADCVEQITELTRDRVTGVPAFASIKDLRKRNRVIQWVKDAGFDFGESLAREVVNTWIETESVKGDHRAQEEPDDTDPDAPTVVGAATNLQLVIRVLQLRQSALRITGGKLEAAGNKVDAYGIIRGLFAYYGAHTGRWAGRGVQVQNLPKPKPGVPIWRLLSLFRRRGSFPMHEVKAILAGEAAKLEAAKRKLKYLPTCDDVASGLIRCLFIPHVGDRVLMAADLAAIEVRVLAWLAGEAELLSSFFTGADPYIRFCKKVTGRDITKRDKERDMWKAGVLGLGFQLGNEARVTAYVATYGIDLGDYGFTAAQFVNAYRDAHPKIAGERVGEFEDASGAVRPIRRDGFWQNLQEAAITCVRDGIETRVGRLQFYKHAGNMYLVLPSGREIVYRNARIVSEFKWGRDRDGVTYSSPRRKSVRLHGGILAENVVQATASDFIRHALVLMHRDGPTPVLHVHDEIVASGRKEQLPEFMRKVTTLPPWADGFPLGAEGGLLPRYAKTPPKGLIWREQSWLNGVRV